MEETKFTHENIEYNVVKPSNKVRKDSDSVYAKSYRKAISDGLFLEAEIDNIIKARGIKAFNDQEKLNYESEIQKLEVKFISSSFDSYEQGIEAYEKVCSLRREIDELEKARRELSSQSASLFAENERFSFFVFSCSKTSDGKKVWGTFDEYKEDVSDLSAKFATEMLAVVYEGARVLLEELSKTKPENIWFASQINPSNPTPIEEKPHKAPRKTKVKIAQ